MHDDRRRRELVGKRVFFVFAGEVLGGAEVGAFELAEELRGNGAVVSVCALDDRPGRARAHAAERGISWSCVKTHWVGNRATKLAALARFAVAVRKERPDVLLSFTNAPNVVSGLTWRATGASLCVWNQTDVNGTTRFNRRLFSRSLRVTPVVVTLADHVRDWLVVEFGADPGKVQVVRSRVEAQQASAPRTGSSRRAGLGLSDDQVVACMLAHFTPAKDHATLLRAWRLLVDRMESGGERPVLLLAGRDAGTMDAVKGMAFDLVLHGYVRFLGDVEDVGGLLDAVDFAVFSSHREALPRGVAEPMAAGLAVAGTDIPGVREPLGKASGPFLAPPGDAAALADAIHALARDPELRARIGDANAKRIHERHDRDSTTRAYATLLADALGGSGAGSPSGGRLAHERSPT